MKFPTQISPILISIAHLNLFFQENSNGSIFQNSSIKNILFFLNKGNTDKSKVRIKKAKWVRVIQKTNKEKKTHRGKKDNSKKENV